GVSRLHGALDFAVFAAVIAAELAEDHIADRTVHGFGHHQRQQGTGRADHGTGNDHRRVLQHETFEGNGQTGEGVVQRDHHRHIGTADRGGQQYAQQQCEDEEQRYHREGDDAVDAGNDDVRTQGQRAEEEYRVDQLLRWQADNAVHATVELGPGDQRAGQRYRTDQTTEYREHGYHHAMGLGIAGEQLGRSNCRGRTATHTIVQG